MRAKLYSQCFVGGARRDMSCIEALILAYPQETRGFVSDRVSTLLGSKLGWGAFFFSFLVAPAKLMFAMVTSAVGVLISLFALSQVFLALPAGRFADRHGLRRPMTLSVAAASGGAMPKSSMREAQDTAATSRASGVVR